VAGRGGWRRLHELTPADDVDRELRGHLEERAAELVSQGWEPSAARAEAERLFGDYLAVQRECREVAERRARSVRRSRMGSELLQDLRYAVRWSARERGFTAMAVLTIALGIGATSAAFSVVRGVLLSPLPYAEPERLVAVREETERAARAAVAWPNFEDWRGAARTVEAMVAHRTEPAPVIGGRETMRVPVAYVSREFFDVMRVQPVLGRPFLPEENDAFGPRAVVVSHGFWRQNLGASPDLAGVQLEIPGGPAAVVGVMPPDFDYPAGAQLWSPLEWGAALGFGDRTAHNFAVTARLAAGASVDAAREELTAIVRDAAAREPSDAVAAYVAPLRTHLVGDTSRALLLLLAAAACVLLVACANLAGALLARSAARRRELAVRTAMGAGRPRLVRQLLTESLLLAGVGAAAGLLLAFVLIRTAGAISPDAFPRFADVRIDGWVLGFTALAAVLTALAFGTAPALRATRIRAHDMLRDGGRGTESRAQRRVWPLLIGAEVAFALLLLVGSGLLARSFLQVVRVDPGFEPRGAITVRMDLPEDGYTAAGARVHYYDEVLRRVRALPGVGAAGITAWLPLAGFEPSGIFRFDDGTMSDGDAAYRIVTPGYFDATRTPIVRGRDFAAHDRDGALPVAIINRSMAATYFAGTDPIGRRFSTHGMDAHGDEYVTIVGVAGDVRHASLTSPATPAYYLPLAQRPQRAWSAGLVVRAATDARELAPVVHATVRAVDGSVALETGSLEATLARTLARERLLLLTLSAFALIALVLAGVGIYGIVAFAVARRTREVGIRIALGARGSGVVWTVARNAVAAVAFGIVVGGAAAFAFAHLLEGLLFEVDPVDPLTFAAVALLLLAAGVLAAVLPARRAAGISPAVALRAE
jgi:putative ABC transport system permease protein